MAAHGSFRVDEIDNAEIDLDCGTLTERAFSFGGDHTDPRSGVPLRDCYVVILAPGNIVQRTVMLALFGQQWCGEYLSEAELITKCGSGARRYAYIRIGSRQVPLGL